jgi:hypothetical protein
MDARYRFMLAGLREDVPRSDYDLLVVFRPFNVGRVVVVSDPPARGFRAAAAGSRRDTAELTAAAAAAAGAAAGAGLLS